jgi:hypothetical protein
MCACKCALKINTPSRTAITLCLLAAALRLEIDFAQRLSLHETLYPSFLLFLFKYLLKNKSPSKCDSSAYLLRFELQTVNWQKIQKNVFLSLLVNTFQSMSKFKKLAQNDLKELMPENNLNFVLFLVAQIEICYSRVCFPLNFYLTYTQRALG